MNPFQTIFSKRMLSDSFLTNKRDPEQAASSCYFIILCCHEQREQKENK